jgi:uncharacterized protein (TIGR02231 family)
MVTPTSQGSSMPPSLARFSTFALPCLLGLPAAAWAADMDVASRIDAVTVYPDAASVTRTGQLDLPAGTSTVTFRGLPIGIDPNSLRFEASAGAQVLIGSVELRPSAATTRPETNVDARLRSLRSDREAWQTTLDALEAKRAMIVRYSQAGPEKLSAEAKPLDIGQWQTAWDTVGQALAKIGDELRAAQGKAREIDEDIQALEKSRQHAPVVATRDVVVSLDATDAAKLDARLTYRIAAAGWQPLYDARLDTGATSDKPMLALVRRAAGTQRTGEDWTGVALTVSTVRSRRGTSAPDLPGQRLAFWEPPRALPADAQAVPAPMAAQSTLSQRSLAVAPKAEAAPAVEQESQVDAGAYQASFQIPGRIDIPGDGSLKSFRIATQQFTPDLSIKSAPAVDDTAYLQAHVTNTGDAPLLPGAVNLTRDGVFVGSGRLPLVATGEPTDLGFGADDNVKVLRVPVRRKENEPTWYGQTKSEQREFRTTVKNLHRFKVSVTILDRMPYSENTAITVDALPPPATTPPTDKAVGDRRGVMAWSFDLAPSESREIRLGYRMKWPADRDILWQTVPPVVGPK